MSSDYIQHLMDNHGAKLLPKEQEQAFLKDVQEKVIPAILEAERQNRIAVHNMRVRQIPLPKKGR
jgi:hypothetical protein